jgi:hypothetical protein
MTMVSFQTAQTQSVSQQTRDQIREQVRASVQDAQRQVREAQRAIEAAQNQATTVRVERIPTPPTPPTPPDLPGQPGVIMIPPSGFNSPADIPPRAQELAMMFFAVMAFIVVGFPIARAIGRWIDRRANAPAIRTADVEPHLLRIEQAIEAMAIEIERISEAQRYLTKLQTGAHSAPMLVPRNQGD